MIAKIEKNKPMPKANKVGRKAKYPFSTMKVGDSIYGDVSTSSLLASANNWAKRNKSKFTFTAQKENEGARVWRTK